jgi:hypothetical protein
MPVQQSDIRIFGSAGIPLQDTDTPVGGAMDPTTEMVFSNIVANDNFQIVSSDPTDTTQGFVLTGRNANGNITTEILTLDGQSPVVCEDTLVWSSLLVGQKNDSCVGVVAVESLTPIYSGAATSTGQVVTVGTPPQVDLSFCVLRVTAGTGQGFIGVILAYNTGTGLAYTNQPVPLDSTSVIRISYGMVFRQNEDGDYEILTVRRPFYNATAPAPASPAKSLLEKVFVYNSNDILTLNNVFFQQALQSRLNISLGVDATLSGTTAAAGNRTGPSPVPMFTGTAVGVPDTALPTNSAIGVWLQLNLSPGFGPVDVPMNFQVLGV